MLKKLLTFIFLPLILLGCSKDEPSNGLFTLVLSEAPQGTEVLIDDTDLSVSISGLEQSITISVLGDYDGIVLSDAIPAWIGATCSERGTIDVSVNKFSHHDENEVRNGVIGFSVFKGSLSLAGRIIIHQNAYVPKLPPAPVHIDLHTIGLWSTFGVSAPGSCRYFSMSNELPSGFQYAKNSATGYSGVLLIMDAIGEVKAFEACCPVEADKDIFVSLDMASHYAGCPVCGSRYDIISNNGAPCSGPALELHYGLRKYEAMKSSDGGYIIYN